MTDLQKQPCQALTKAGKPCQLPAQPSQPYCHVHQGLAQPTAAAAEPAAATGASQHLQGQLAALIGELEGLVEQLKSQTAKKEPSPFSPAALLRLVQQNVDRFTPELVRDLRNSLQGASKEDLVDPETWKGMWYMLSYSAQFQVDQLKQRLTGQDEDE